MPKTTKKIEEESTMQSGAVEVSAGTSLRDENDESHINMPEGFYTSRESFIEEMQLREVIREMAHDLRKEKLLQESKRKSNILQLRGVIRQLIKEANKDIEDAPHSSTAINILEELLKSILPNLETDYKTLTTKREQRDSFRAHIVNAVSTALETEDINNNTDMIAAGQLDEQDDDEISLKISDTENFIDDKFIDIEDSPIEEIPEEEIDTFGIEGQDETGRAMSQKAFEKIEKNIIETYGILSDEDDQKLFKDYLITNLKLYFDKWEKELGAVVEPTTDEYESEKEEIEASDELGSELGGGLGGEELIQ
jgi:hypothetical protein